MSGITYICLEGNSFLKDGEIVVVHYDNSNKDMHVAPSSVAAKNTATDAELGIDEKTPTPDYVGVLSDPSVPDAHQRVVGLEGRYFGKFHTFEPKPAASLFSSRV
jgi:hypothetical protein